jgi:hypothetical protein
MYKWSITINMISFFCLPIYLLGQSVGIGTQNPIGEFHINDTDNNQSVVARMTTASQEFIFGLNVSNQCFIGTETNHDVRIRSNGVNRLVVDNIGNIGIGITAPSQKLEVNNGSVFLSDLGSTNEKGFLLGESEHPVYGWIYNGLGSGNENQLHLREYLGDSSDVLTVKGDGRLFLNKLSGTNARPLIVEADGSIKAGPEFEYVMGGGHTSDLVHQEYLKLPNGVQVESIKYRYKDNSTSGSARFTFVRVDFLDFGNPFLLPFTSGDSFASPDYQIEEISIPANYRLINNELYTYFISISVDDANDGELAKGSYQVKYSY